ncbi:MAG: CDP-alcohol phosphatidyltransferase family protein [Chloroflexi bacterium]|nr:CDP-alcohol phosphatidyltransferase family protein [Chloroflexota bacterium]
MGRKVLRGKPLPGRLYLRRLLARFFEEPAARLLHRMGLSPNAVTLLGLVLSGGAAYLASTGRFLPAGLVLLASGVFDFLDGAVARLSGRATAFGALLDSVADRVAEAGVFLGLLVFYLERGAVVPSLLCYLAFAGSVLVSYVRARSEGVGIPGAAGIMTRPERVVVLAVGLLAKQVPIALGIIAALALFTSLQRMYHSWRSAGGK